MFVLRFDVVAPKEAQSQTKALSKVGSTSKSHKHHRGLEPGGKFIVRSWSRGSRDSAILIGTTSFRSTSSSAPCLGGNLMSPRHGVATGLPNCLAAGSLQRSSMSASTTSATASAYLENPVLSAASKVVRLNLHQDQQGCPRTGSRELLLHEKCISTCLPLCHK